ncbi:MULTISPECIES: methionine--tRNA ligase [unclassified Helicobacter]|uniref:methionine--tRNA ligase n=1 Tax=unclassified Helicobacter TaxID=2593540 RepID=UPI000CF012C5|nr:MULTISPECIES: methionine--tRNA ligase [unclassified Helicobacter]
MKSFITTPIYYVNDVPHIGHAYTTFIADMLKRYHQLRGRDVFFLTGTDEHGQKIEQSATKKSQSPKDYADFISAKFRDLWDVLAIDYDYFIRTTDSNHIAGVQKAFEIMYQKGDIYKGEYEGNYCVSCESYFTNSQLQNGCCPDCGRKTTLIKEESYFFALSKYQDQLLQWYETDCILPRFRKNEVISFVKGGLNDLSITRTSFEWGIKLPKSLQDEKHIIYVWLDALMNYVSALGYGSNNFDLDLWKNATHIVGKDILRFHAVYWPAFLMSLDLPLPKHIYVHGWWLIDGVKMSKSLGNVVNPKEIVEEFGTDTLRYFLMREVSFGQDGDFSKKALVNKINAELADVLGNLLNRLLGMAEKYFDLRLECKKEDLPEEINEVSKILDSLNGLMEEMKPSKYLEELWKMFALGNLIVAKYEPWRLIKEGEVSRVQGLLVLLCNILIKGSLSLYPIMPSSASKILEVFGLTPNSSNYKKFVQEAKIETKFELKKVSALFPKVELKQDDEKKECDKKVEELKNFITIDEFKKIEIKIGTVIKAEAIPKSTKLLKLQVDLGEGRLRQIVSGISQFYQAEMLINKQVCVLSNLKPTKLMGEISEGMILAVSDDEGLSLLSIDHFRKNGSRVS